MNIDEVLSEYVISVLTNHAVTNSQTCYSNTTTTKVSTLVSSKAGYSTQKIMQKSVSGWI